MEIATMEAETGMDRLNKQKQVLSPLMQAKKNAKNGQKVNACPFGCTVAQLDEIGLCKHVVGITVPGDQTRYEPVVRKRGRRVVSVEREKIPTGETNEDGEAEFDWGPPLYHKVQAADKLVRITTSCRVYRENVPDQPRTAVQALPKAMTAEQREAMAARLRDQLAELELEMEAAADEA